MSILLLYATTEGQTKKIVERAAVVLRSLGKDPVLHDMASSRQLQPLSSFEGVVLAASVHQSYHQQSATDFTSAAVKSLNAMPSAFISVSLSAAMPDGRTEAQHYRDSFLEATGWKPNASLLLGGAIRLSGYDYFERQVMKYILAQRGVTDTTADYECTDWAALEAFIRLFVSSKEAKAAESTPIAAASR